MTTRLPKTQPTPELSDAHSPACPDEEDYAAIEAAVMETARGRWFLQEYAKRNRRADTDDILTALERLEERIAAGSTAGGDTTSMALLSHDVLDLAEAITRVKREVQELGAQANGGDHFSSATDELEAIVTQTETATGEILEAAEKVQEVVWTLRESGADETQCDIIESKIIEIYTACSFQDLTGQRSNKVVKLVSYVERRIATMMDVLGLTAADGASAMTQAARSAPTGSTGGDGVNTTQSDSAALLPSTHSETSEDGLLNGPALPGQGNDQSDVDALFDTQLRVQPEAPDDADDVAADMFEASVYGNAEVVEIHDAEILNYEVDEAILKAHTSADTAAPDIFDVETLMFSGTDMADYEDDTNLDAIHERAASRGLSETIISTGDDFALDTWQDDELDLNEDLQGPELAEPSKPAQDDEAHQDLFEVDSIAFETDLDEDLAAFEVSEPDKNRAKAAVDEDESESTAQPVLVDHDRLDQADETKASAHPLGDLEPVDYTAEERIALFS